MRGNIMANTRMKMMILPEKSKRVMPSTPLVPITTKAPRSTVKARMDIFSVLSLEPKRSAGNTLANNEPPPVI